MIVYDLHSERFAVLRDKADPLLILDSDTIGCPAERVGHDEPLFNVMVNLLVAKRDPTIGVWRMAMDVAGAECQYIDLSETQC